MPDTATITYTSLPGTAATDESPYNSSSTERTGNAADPGGALNTYAATSASVTTTVNTNSIGGSDPGIAGATVGLTGLDNLNNPFSLTTTTTDAAGGYTSAGLRPGTYSLTLTPPGGHLDGKDAAGTLGRDTSAEDRVSGIAVPSMAAGTGYDFAEFLPGTIAGTVYDDDADDDGTRPASEPGRAGAVLTVTGTDDRGNAFRPSATSAPDGTYSFSGLRPGTYAVNKTPPAGELDGHASPGNLGGTAGSSRSISGIPLGEDRSGIAYNSGVLDPASIASVADIDPNDDGIDLPGEAGIPGVSVTLAGTRDLGFAVAATIISTASDGSYSFPNPRPGTYSVTEAAPGGTIDGKVTPGPDGGTAGPGKVSGIVLASGTSAPGNDFAAFHPASLAGIA